MEAIGKVVKGLGHRYKRTIGAVSMAGDRRDEDLMEMGRIAAGIFDELIFREDPSTRGRPRGEVMRHLRQGALAAGRSPDFVHLIAGEAASTRPLWPGAAWRPDRDHPDRRQIGLAPGQRVQARRLGPPIAAPLAAE